VSEIIDKIKIGYISTWNVKCGIAEYTKFIFSAMVQTRRVEVEVFPLIIDTYKKTFNLPQYITVPLRAGKRCNVIDIQYHPSFFTVHPRLSLFPLVVEILKHFSKAKIVVTIHELGSRLDTIYLNKVNTVIVHSDTTYNKLIKDGVNNDKIVHIPHFTVIGEELDRDECKRKLGLSGKRVIAIFGFIHQNKGHDLLVNAMPYLPKDTVLLVLGEAKQEFGTAYKEELAAKVKELGLRDRVIFKGFVNDTDMPTVMNAADVAVFPYRWVEVSGALHMVLGFKIPCVASDLDYFKEVEQKYHCIQLFKSGDVQGLINTLKCLLSNADNTDYLRKQCDKFINATCLDVITTQRIGCYMEAIAGHPASIYNDVVQKERINWLRDNKKGSTLEVGCATGFVTYYVKADVGLDIREDRLTVAQNKYQSTTFVKGDVTSLPFRSGSFETVMAPDILEHVPQKAVRQVVEELLRVCSGEVLITVPNGDRKGYGKDKVVGGKNPEHLWPPTKENISNLLNGLKYEIQLSQSGYFLLIKLGKQ